MTVYECRCGFASGTAVGFQRHIARYKGETGKHRMVSKSDAAGKPPSKSANAVDAQTTVEASQPSERSWLSGLWASDATIQGKPNTEEGSFTATDTPDRPSKAIKDVKKFTEDADMLEPSSSGGESAWEKVSSFADSGEEGPSVKDDYAALTAQLAASGPAAGTKTKSKRPASASRKSKLAPQQTLEETETAKTSTPISADPASPTPVAAPTAPSLETPSRASSQTLSHTTAAAPDDMQRAASHGSASPSKLDTVHTQSLTTGGQADGSPAAGASTSLDAQQAAEPSTLGNPSTSSPQRAETSTRSPSPPVCSVSPLKEDELHQRGRQIMRKSVGVVNWLKASTDAALTMHPASAQSIQALEQRNACSADDVEAVLLWREPMQTSKLFLGGMYILICLRQLVLGVELLQPSTAIAGVLLALLLGNTVRVALMPASQRQPPRQELALQAQITQAVSRRGAQMASVLGAIAVVMHRRLSGHDRTGTTVWLALTLWTTMALGEAALLSQSSMSLAVWCAIFGLPSLYLQCRHILDVLVEEALQLVAAFLRAGQRGTLVFAAAAGLVVLTAVPLTAALMDETDPTFQAAADFVESHASNVTDGHKLDLYGLYKQATSGPCSTAKPSLFDFRGRAKWSAWNSVGKLSEAEAREHYVRLVHQFFPSWQPDAASNQPRGTPAGPVFSSLAHPKGDIVVPGSLASDSLHIRASEGDVAGVRKLLTSGVAVDQRDDQGCTALHWAADRGAEQVITVLLSYGADINATDEDGQTPLQYALLCDHQQAYNTLVKAVCALGLLLGNIKVASGDIMIQFYGN
ncbi:hypothetical protein WJX79_005832 [Trebouxia sp. C0005]